MGKLKSIFILFLAIVCVLGIVMAAEAPTTIGNSKNLIPISDSSDSNQSDCVNGTCPVDSKNLSSSVASSLKDNSSSEDDNESSGGEMDYDSKYYDDSFIDGLYFCNDLEHALKDAKDHHRNIMIIFDGEACIYCEYLKEQGLTDSDVQKEINENDIIMITDTSDSAELAEELQIYGTPTTVVFDEDGHELGRIEGYDNPHQYLSELRDYNGNL